MQQRVDARHVKVHSRALASLPACCHAGHQDTEHLAEASTAQSCLSDRGQYKQARKWSCALC